MIIRNLNTVEFLAEVHRQVPYAVTKNTPCRDGKHTVPRWQTHRAAMANTPCRDGRHTVVRFDTHRRMASLPVCGGQPIGADAEAGHLYGETMIAVWRM